MDNICPFDRRLLADSDLDLALQDLEERMRRGREWEGSQAGSPGLASTQEPQYPSISNQD